MKSVYVYELQESGHPHNQNIYSLYATLRGATPCDFEVDLSSLKIVLEAERGTVSSYDGRKSNSGTFMFLKCF